MKLEEFLELTTAKQKKVKNDDLQKLCKDNKIPYETDNNKDTLIDKIKAHKPEEPKEEPAAEEEKTGTGFDDIKFTKEPSEEQPTETETPQEMEDRIRGEIRDTVEAQFRSEIRDEMNMSSEEMEANIREKVEAELREEMYPEIRKEVELQIAEAQSKAEAEEPAAEEPTKEEPAAEEPKVDSKHELKVRNLMGGFYTGDKVKYECHGQTYPNLNSTTIAFADESHLIINHEKGNYHNSMPKHLRSVLKAEDRFVAAAPSELIAL